nr:MAG TPA: MURAMOYL-PENTAPEPTIDE CARBOXYPEPTIDASE, NUCLEAR RECEPTOR, CARBOXYPEPTIDASE.8A [Caudoviricetes sp.]
MIGFNPTISNVFTYPDMASQLERLNANQSKELRNAVSQAVDIYKFKTLKKKLEKQEAEKKAQAEAKAAEKKAEAERRKAMDETWADYYDYVSEQPSRVMNLFSTPESDVKHASEDLDENALDYDLMHGVLTSPKQYTPQQIKDVQFMAGVTDDGKFDPNTRAAIAKKLQETIGVTADGIWGKNSEAAWNDWLKKPDYSLNQ